MTSNIRYEGTPGTCTKIKISTLIPHSLGFGTVFIFPFKAHFNSSVHNQGQSSSTTAQGYSCPLGKEEEKLKKKKPQPARRISYLAVIILSACSEMELCQILLAGGPCRSILLVQSICEIRSVILKR